MMHAITIPLFEEMQLASGRSAAQLDADLKLYLATKLYEMSQVTLGQAAEIAGLSKIAFVDALGVMKVPVIRWDVAEAEQEFADG